MQYSSLELKSYLQTRRRRRRSKKAATILLFIFLLLSLFVFFNKFIKSNFSKDPDPVSEQNINNSLGTVVKNTLQDAKGTYAIAIKNLKNKDSYYSNEHQIFEAGSLYKLWIMAETYEQIQNNKLTEDEILSQDVSALNAEFNIDPSSAELTEGTVTFSVHDALNQMITISHNYAALILTQKIKLSSVSGFLKTNGFIESWVGADGSSPKSSAFDILAFYEKLYKGELGGIKNTEKMVSLLKNQQLNDGLPKYLPDKSRVVSKTGDIGWFKHDAGIVYTEKGDYIIVVMSESESPSGAQERIALLSKAVYDYFEESFK